MFDITNLSNNPLTLSDKKMIAPGETRKLKSISDAEAKYKSRNWLQIVELKKEDADTGGKNK